jgi:tetratricopeptide (TPR) repeat protein
MVQVKTSQSQELISEGFDLDALAEGGNGQEEDVVYEIGGTASVVVPPPSAKKEEQDTTTSASKNKASQTDNATKEETSSTTETDIADEYKAKGNAAFKEHNWLEAVDMYTAAINSLPGMTSVELLKLRDEYEVEQHAQMRKRLAEQDERRREKAAARTKSQERKQGDEKDDDDKEEETKDPSSVAPPSFTAPPHVHAGRLAVLHANRAAALLHLEEYEKALLDCDVAILWNPTYVKAYLRRASLHEKHDDNTEAALRDAKTAQSIDPSNRQILVLVKRLQKLEDERLEKLKAETLVRNFSGNTDDGILHGIPPYCNHTPAHSSICCLN